MDEIDSFDKKLQKKLRKLGKLNSIPFYEKCTCCQQCTGNLLLYPPKNTPKESIKNQKRN